MPTSPGHDEEFNIVNAHSQDLQLVSDTVFGEQIQRIRTKIFMGSASHDEIIDHYRSQDPLLEHFSYGDILAPQEVHNLLLHYDNMSYANFLGGLALLYDTTPTENTTRDFDNTHQVITKVARALGVSEQTRLLKVIDRRSVDLHISYAGVSAPENYSFLDYRSSSTRLLGAQAIRSGVVGLRNLEIWRPISPYKQIEHGLSMEVADSIVFGTILTSLANKFNTDGSINKEALGQAIEATKLCAAPIVAQEVGSSYFTDIQRIYFGLACSFIEEAIQGCDASDLRHSSVKGNLHEALWMLDAFALIKGNPKYGHLHAVSSDYAQDRGNIKDLLLRRGYDFKVIDERSGQTKYIQLKSHTSRRHDKPYHISIEKYREEDFHESIGDPNLILEKLRAYRTWSEASFDATMYASLGISTMAMQTIKDVLNSLL